MGNDKTSRKFIETTIRQFLSENVENDKDRTKLKSSLFFVDNVYKNNEGQLKYVEIKPFDDHTIHKIVVFSNSVVFYRNGEPINQMPNISMDSNIELVRLIEDRLNELAHENV